MLERRSAFPRALQSETLEVNHHDQSLWSPEKRDRIEKATREWEVLMRQQEGKADWLEKFGSRSVSNIISVGRGGSKLYDAEKYTSLAIRKKKFDDKKVIWLSFPGLNSADSGEWNFFLEGSASVPGGIDAIPREGTGFVFHGP